MNAFWILLALFWGLPIFVAHHLGLSRGRTGWLWGLLLGWVGVFILALMRPRTAVDELHELEARRQLELLEAQAPPRTSIWR
jgi:hypothetical protein